MVDGVWLQIWVTGVHCCACVLGGIDIVCVCMCSSAGEWHA